MKTFIAIFTMMLMTSAVQAESITVDNQARKMPGHVKNAEQIMVKVKEFTHINADVGELKIIVHATRGDLNVWLESHYPEYDGVVAIYEVQTNVIHTYPGVTAYVLAHEFTHVLVHKSGMQIEKGHAEDLPHYVEQNIKLGWL